MGKISVIEINSSVNFLDSRENIAKQDFKVVRAISSLTELWSELNTRHKFSLLMIGDFYDIWEPGLTSKNIKISVQEMF